MELIEVPGTDDVIMSDQDGTISRVDLATGETAATGESASGEPLVNLAVSADGSVGVAQEVDSGIYQVMHAETLTPIADPIAGLGAVMTSTPPPIVDPQGSSFAMPVPGRRLLVFEVDVEWEEWACSMVGRSLTHDEWTRHIGPDEPYGPTCPAIAPGGRHDARPTTARGLRRKERRHDCGVAPATPVGADHAVLESTAVVRPLMCVLAGGAPGRLVRRRGPAREMR